MPAIACGQSLLQGLTLDFADGEGRAREWAIARSRGDLQNRAPDTPSRPTTMSLTTVPQTLFDKLWQRHVVLEESGGLAMLYVDRQLVYEVVGQADEGHAGAGRGHRAERHQRQGHHP